MDVFYCNAKGGICDHQSCNTCEICDGTGGEYRKDENPYWERICKLSERQRAKGMSTYGQGLENNSAAILERINHLEEELVDGLMYCEWLKDKIAEGKA